MGRYQFGDIGLVRLLYSGLGQVFAMTAGLVVGAGLLHAYRLDTSTFVLLCAAIVLTIVRVATIQSFQWLSRDLTQPAAARWEILYGACAVATGLVVADMTLESFHNGTPGLQLLSLGLSFALCNGQSSVRVASRIWIALASGWIVLGALAIACFMLDDPTVKVTGGLVVLYAFAYTASCRNSSQTLLGRLEAEQELARLAREDVLTALGNRRAFEEELLAAAQRGHHAKVPYAILCLDLDGFKAVNDELGHRAGDELLSQVGSRLQGAVRAGDHEDRVGGDEFAILVKRFRDLAEIEQLAERLVELLSQAYDVDGAAVSIGVSVGIATAPESGWDGASVRATADEALYAAKRAGKGRWTRAAQAQA